MVDALLIRGVGEDAVLLEDFLLVAGHLGIGSLFAGVLVVEGVLMHLGVKA